MPHEIHTSERRSFRGCRRRWNWAYREGFVPEQPPKPLEFGIAFHMGMEAFYEPSRWTTTSVNDKIQIAVEVFTQECISQRDKYLENTNQAHLDSAQGDDYMERVELGAGMFLNYGLTVHTRFDDWIEPVYVEVPFTVPIQHPERDEPLRCLNSPHCGQSHSNDPTSDDSLVVFSGRVDAIMKDKRYGGYLIWDHKTAASLAPNDDFLQLDDQVGSYPWALSTVLGIDVRGFIYQEIRKDYPRPPDPLKKKWGGRLFSTNKQQATTAAIFVPHVKMHDPEGFADSKYDDYIQYLHSDEAPKFHQRFTVIKSDRELYEIGRNISLEAADMVEPNLRIYPAVGRFTCTSCAFRQPCLGTFMGEDVDYLFETQYLQTNRRYWMDAPPNSDKANK